jgi:DNA-3-methyladenine glycosylase I
MRKEIIASEVKEIIKKIDAKLTEFSVNDSFNKWIDRYSGMLREDDKIFGMVAQAIFSGGMKGEIVDKKMPTTKTIFFNWDLCQIINLTDEDLIKIAKNEGVIGNINKLKAIRDNAKKVMDIQKKFGSFFNFLYSFDDVDQLAHNLTDKSSSNKLKFIGETTVHDFLRNIGYNAIKPDRHVKRWLQRVGYLESPAIENKILDVARSIADAGQVTLPYLDSLIYLFCGDRPDVIKRAICANISRCEECPITQHCQYFSNRG